VQIPLDYYRILGLPIQATADQLQQAHRDRGLQLPRREFSDIAIEGRKQLIDEAYRVLSDDDRRRDYDSKFLASAYRVDLPGDSLSGGSGPDVEVNAELGEAALRSLATDAPGLEGQPSTIDIEETQFAGALLLLLELGEYEQVIQLGRPYLSSGSRNLQDGSFGDSEAVLSDIVLNLALACLELGREQWQQRQYETAAESLETGNELLVEENRFPSIRAEIQTELYKLRPYRILELLARPLDQTRERRQGMKLLKAMLEDRGGIEGTEDDLSGLAIDDFLRFIQQLRDYLTASEQQELFEHEARRPSPVATYLTIYALLARGFARHQPALVRRAKQLLVSLGAQQDVHLEQAVCALLLGQTEEANRALELSQEYEPLAYIREHSRNSPDLLPGLCLYAERWLKEEVFPHFRDFRDQEATLKDYFADAQVQAYLESMPVAPAMAEAGPQAPQFPVVEGSLPIGAPSTMPIRPPKAPVQPPTNRVQPPPSTGREQPLPYRNGKGSGEQFSAPPQSLKQQPDALPLEHIPSVAERIAQMSPEGRLDSGAGNPPPLNRKLENRRQPKAPAAKQPPAKSDTALAPTQTKAAVAPPQRRSGGSPRWGRLALVALAGLVGVSTLGFLTMRTMSWIAGAFSGPRLEGRPLDISVSEPAFEIPSAPTADEQIGVEEIAERVVNDWLSAKRSALGPDYQADQLETILIEPLLTQWRRRADAASQESWYWEYEHNVEVESVTPDDPTSDSLQAVVMVTEQAKLFEYGEENTGAAYNDTLRMQYDLVRQDGDWYIQGMTKLE
jgi:curved DNA-binding protein CbpA